jgi:hypothetical protein
MFLMCTTFFIIRRETRNSFWYRHKRWPPLVYTDNEKLCEVEVRLEKKNMSSSNRCTILELQRPLRIERKTRARLPPPQVLSGTFTNEDKYFGCPTGCTVVPTDRTPFRNSTDTRARENCGNVSFPVVIPVAGIRNRAPCTRKTVLGVKRKSSWKPPTNLSAENVWKDKCFSRSDPRQWSAVRRVRFAHRCSSGVRLLRCSCQTLRIEGVGGYAACCWSKMIRNQKYIFGREGGR